VDGGMTANGVFLRALADACGRPVERSSELEATARGAGYLAGLAVGLWADEEELAGAWQPAEVVEPSRAADREQWRTSVERAKAWYPELTAVQF
ncbi:MAG TPA: FGGY-family carbohydrate kinase, partial [Acidimicrobiales bacterium]|nr:FGGY-family carbohydrate kinase [Acidimicrobiales bacterium]